MTRITWLRKAVLSALGTIWKTVVAILTLTAGIAAFLSIMAAAGVIKNQNPVTVLWETPADLARGINALVQLGDSLEGVDLASWFEATEEAASRFNSAP